MIICGYSVLHTALIPRCQGIKSITYTLLLLFACVPEAQSAKLRNVYLDAAKNVHVVTSTGKDIKVSTGGHRAQPALSPDGEAAAWLVLHKGGDTEEKELGGSELEIYRSGQIRSIMCEPFIRDYWFWRKGTRVAIDCGGSHFAGREILYDVKTLKEIDSFDQSRTPPENRPSWSMTGDNYQPDF